MLTLRIFIFGHGLSTYRCNLPGPEKIHDRSRTQKNTIYVHNEYLAIRKVQSKSIEKKPRSVYEKTPAQICISKDEKKKR